MENKIKKVLIVDDSDDDRFLAKKILEKHGYAVIDAGNWLDALNYIDSGEIDLILLDLRMPEMDGFELLGLIREHNTSAELPVIVYTAANTVDANDCAIRGSNAFVRKYSDPRILVNKVEETLSII